MIKFGAENCPVKPAELPFIIKSGEGSFWLFLATSISENSNLYFFTKNYAGYFQNLSYLTIYIGIVLSNKFK